MSAKSTPARSTTKAALRKNLRAWELLRDVFADERAIELAESSGHRTNRQEGGGPETLHARDSTAEAPEK